MSEYVFELIKIIIDKGLLGLIVLSVAFYLNKAIEKLRARNIYYQKLSEAKLEAYQELSELLTIQMNHLMHIVKICKGSLGGRYKHNEAVKKLVNAS